MALFCMLALAPSAMAQSSAGASLIRGGDSGDSGMPPSGGGGGGSGVTLFDIVGMDQPITWGGNGTGINSPACQAIVTSFNARQKVNETMEKACQRSIGSQIGNSTSSFTCDVWNPYPEQPGSRAPTSALAGKACLAQPPSHPGNLNDPTGPGSNEETHPNYKWMMDNGTQLDATRGRAVAWIIRVWRTRLVGDTTLPLRGLAQQQNSDRYPVFERRSNLNVGDPRSDAGIVNNFGGGSVTWNQWWSGGPNGGPAGGNAAEGPGNWWRNVPRAGPIAWMQPEPVQEQCNDQYESYRTAVKARNGGEMPAKINRPLARLINRPTACFYHFTDAWFDDADGKLFGEAFALGWERTDRFAWTSYAIVAPAGYVYAVQVAQIDRAEQIISSSTRIYFPAPVCTGTCSDDPKVDTPPPPPAPDVQVRTRSALSVTTGSPRAATLDVVGAPGFGLRESGGAEQGQQAWPLSTTAMWWDAQQFSNPTWDTRNAILNVRETTDRAPDAGADRMVANPQINPGNNLGFTVGPNVTAGQVRAISQSVVLEPDGELVPSAGAAPIPVSRLAQPGEQVEVTRSFQVASSAPNVRLGEEISPLQMAGSADVERGRWQQAAAPDPLPSQDLRQPDCARSNDLICIERVAVRARQKASAGAGGCPADQCYAVPDLRNAAGAPRAQTQLVGAYLKHPVTGYLKVRLDAANPAGLRALSVHDAASDNGSIRRSLYTSAGPRRVTNPSDPDQWSITWCRSGEFEGTRLARIGSLIGNPPPDHRGDAGCQSDWNQWSWQLRSEVACEGNGVANPRPDQGQCVLPASQIRYDLCPAPRTNSPGQPGWALQNAYLSTAYGLRADGMAGDGAAVRGLYGVVPDGIFPWQAAQAPCVVPGRFFEGRWNKVANRTRARFICGRLDTASGAIQERRGADGLGLWGCAPSEREIGVVDVWSYYEFTPRPGGALFYPGWSREDLINTYKAQFSPTRSSTAVDLYQSQRYCDRAGGTPRRCLEYKYRWTGPSRSVRYSSAPDNSGLNEYGYAGGTALFANHRVYATGGEAPTRVNDNYRAGYTRLTAARGWQYTPRQIDCRDNMNENGSLQRDVRGCGAVDPQHTGYRLGLGTKGNGWYFLSGMATPTAGQANWSVWQVQPRGSNWQWQTQPPTTTAEPFKTRVIGLQPSR